MGWFNAIVTAISLASSLFERRRPRSSQSDSMNDAILRGVKAHLANVARVSPTYAWEHRARIEAGKTEELKKRYSPDIAAEKVLTEG